MATEKDLDHMLSLIDQEGAGLRESFTKIDPLTRCMLHQLLMAKFHEAVKDQDVTALLTYRLALYGMMMVTHSIAREAQG